MQIRVCTATFEVRAALHVLAKAHFDSHFFFGIPCVSQHNGTQSEDYFQFSFIPNSHLFSLNCLVPFLDIVIPSFCSLFLQLNDSLRLQMHLCVVEIILLTLSMKTVGRYPFPIFFGLQMCFSYVFQDSLFSVGLILYNK